MFDLHRALTADGIAICRPADYVSGKKASLEDYCRDVIALLTDYPPARFYFVRFSDETISIDTPFGEARCFGKYGYGGAYFVVGADGRVWLYSPEAENDWEKELVFANSSLDLFVQTYCRLMAEVFLLKSGFVVKGGLPKNGEIAENLIRWLEQADSEAAAEDAFWGQLLYELEDGFFPLMDNPVTRDVGMPEHRYLESERSSEKL